jgi:hypothetical protein
MQIGNNSLTGSAVVTLPDGSRHTVPIRNGIGMLNVQLDVPPGNNLITVSSPTGGVPAPILISHVHFEPTLIARFLAHAAS